jgi:hypothetical protein
LLRVFIKFPTGLKWYGISLLIVARSSSGIRGDKAVDVVSQALYWSPEYAGDDAKKALEWCKNRLRGFNWMVKFAAKYKKPMAISEWGATGRDLLPPIYPAI